MADPVENGNFVENMENSNTKPEQTDVNLTDDENPQGKQFRAATLELDGEGTGEMTGVTGEEVEFRGPGLERNRPFSASMVSRKSTTSTKSRTSLSPHVITTPMSTNAMFCYRDGVFEYAVEDCQKVMIKAELDGELRGAWLLTEIDHWDNEREKLVLLTDLSLIVVRYDFVNKRPEEWKRIFLHLIHTLQIGDFVYPPKSLMPARDHGGIRLIWGSPDDLSFSQRWNPWSSEIPFISLAHHPLLYNEKERETVTFNVDDFCDSVMQGIRQANTMKATDRTLKVEEGPISITSYASVSSLIFNQSHLGFNRDRNGINF